MRINAYVAGQDGDGGDVAGRSVIGKRPRKTECLGCDGGAVTVGVENRGVGNESSNVGAGGTGQNFLWRRYLLDDASIENDDAVCNGQSFGSIVSDMDGCEALGPG